MVAPICHTPVSGFAKKTAPKHWIWQGILAAGSITLLTSRWKTGKTTLISVLLSKLGTGGTLAGREITATRAVVLSEESEELWEERHGRLNFADNIHFTCRPFGGRPTLAEWTGFLRQLEEEQEAPGVLVLDPLAMFLPGSAESYAPEMINTLFLLRRLTALGWAILLLHHPIKGRSERELTERSTGALTGFVDIEVKLYRDTDAVSARIRRLTVESRPYGFNDEFRVELAEDGKDFLEVAQELDFSTYEEGLYIIKAMIVDEGPMTRMKLWKIWPEDFDRPSLPTLRRWLWRAQEEGVIEHTGSGRRRDAFVYKIIGADPKPARPDPHKVIEEAMRRMRNQAGAPDDEVEGDE